MDAQPQCSCWDYEGWGVGEGNTVWGHPEKSQLSNWGSPNTVGSHFVVREPDTPTMKKLPEAHPVLGGRVGGSQVQTSPAAQQSCRDGFQKARGILCWGSLSSVHPGREELSIPFHKGRQ